MGEWIAGFDACLSNTSQHYVDVPTASSPTWDDFFHDGIYPQPTNLAMWAQYAMYSPFVNSFTMWPKKSDFVSRKAQVLLLTHTTNTTTSWTSTNHWSFSVRAKDLEWPHDPNLVPDEMWYSSEFWYDTMVNQQTELIDEGSGFWSDLKSKYEANPGLYLEPSQSMWPSNTSYWRTNCGYSAMIDLAVCGASSVLWIPYEYTIKNNDWWNTNDVLYSTNANSFPSNYWYDVPWSGQTRRWSYVVSPSYPLAATNMTCDVMAFTRIVTNRSSGDMKWPVGPTFKRQGQYYGYPSWGEYPGYDYDDPAGTDPVGLFSALFPLYRSELDWPYYETQWISMINEFSLFGDTEGGAKKRPRTALSGFPDDPMYSFLLHDTVVRSQGQVNATIWIGDQSTNILTWPSSNPRVDTNYYTTSSQIGYSYGRQTDDGSGVGKVHFTYVVDDTVILISNWAVTNGFRYQ